MQNRTKVFLDGLRIQSLNFWLNAHSRQKHLYLGRLAKNQRQTSAAVCRCMLDKPQLPAVVTMTRIAPRKLDEGDNLSGGFKHIRDGIADWLEVDDGSDLITWKYCQRKGKPKQYAAEIVVESVKKEDDV